jgi:hypothetical protein
MPHVAAGQFTGAITAFKNQHIQLAIRPCIDIITELVGNDEFKSRAGTDDSTKRHFVQLIRKADQARRLITYNAENVDIKAIVDIDGDLQDSLKPLATDTVQLGSTPDVEIPWRLDGTDENIPLWSELHFRNGIGGVLYSSICSIVVAWTRLESRNRSHMITVNDSLRIWSHLQGFYDLCDRLLGVENQVDLAQPLATDEPEGVVPPNRLNESVIAPGSSIQNAQRNPGAAQ